jgi:hypothetical protein
MDFDVVLDVFRAFPREGVRYKVVGAVAMNLMGLPRATDDLDIFVEPGVDKPSGRGIPVRRHRGRGPGH